LALMKVRVNKCESLLPQHVAQSRQGRALLQ
jgi:hypothetical protein